MRLPFVAALLTVAALGIALSGTGCSFLLETAEPRQCSSDSDCEANPSLRNRTCQSGFCAVPARDPGVESPDGGGTGCESTARCTAENSGQLSVCKQRGSACQIWQTAQCSHDPGPLASDPNVIMIGSILPLTVLQWDGTRQKNDYADRVRRAIDLAVSEVAAELPQGILLADGKRHPLAVLHCDSGMSATGAELAMRHLTEVVGAPAVIVGADEDIHSVAALATAKQTAIACEGCLGSLPPGPLAWRIVPRLELEAPMTSWRVSKLEAEIKALPSAPAQIKVALLSADEWATRDYVTKLRSVLRFNGGQTVAQNGTATFQSFVGEDPRVTAVDHAKHIKDIVAFEPDIILVAMGTDFTSYYLPGIEAAWKGARRPHYITTTLNYTLAFTGPVGTNEDLRKRISGTRPGFAAPLQANIEAFDDRYRFANDFKNPDGNFSGYDAFYTLAMGVLAARTQLVMDGIHISEGLGRLRSGPVLDFKPESIQTATIALGETTASIDVRGLWSNLDWNLNSHDFDSDVSMYCLKRDATQSLVLQPDAGPRLSATTGLVEGDYTCD